MYTLCTWTFTLSLVNVLWTRNFILRKYLSNPLSVCHYVTNMTVCTSTRISHQYTRVYYLADNKHELLFIKNIPVQDVKPFALVTARNVTWNGPKTVLHKSAYSGCTVGQYTRLCLRIVIIIWNILVWILQSLVYLLRATSSIANRLSCANFFVSRSSVSGVGMVLYPSSSGTADSLIGNTDEIRIAYLQDAKLQGFRYKTPRYSGEIAGLV